MDKEDVLIQEFSVDTLSNYFRRIIPSFNTKKQNYDDILERFDKRFNSLEKLGKTNLEDNNVLIVVACQYSGYLSERSSKKQQFEITKKVLKEEKADAAIFVFYDDEKQFRFSFIMRNISSKERYSDWRRYTYFVSCKETNRTFKERLKNCAFDTLDSIKEAFSVEKLTKDFYNQLYQWYEWVKSEEVGVTFPNDVRISEDDRDNLDERIIRLITRLLFVWFIKQKHLVPDNLFKKEALYKILKNFDPTSLTDGNYYNAILQNLFFATLNRAVGDRCFATTEGSRDIKTKYRYKDKFMATSEEEIIELFSPVPFLNGGLFECLDKEKETHGIKYHLDGFSRNHEKDAKGRYKEIAFIPNIVFFDAEKGLFPILERFNFTVEENEPSEIQVALDPELLGNVFENLLSAYNSETSISARKQSGSFYTPKEIVHYMVDESIIVYLKNAKISLSEEEIRYLVEGDRLPDVLENNDDLCSKVYQKLRAIKIVDPACGSGAFPMGILKRMIQIMEKLHPENDLYDLKLHLIEECIYGIDLQTIAIQITKLRFFISLIVDQNNLDIANQEGNYNIRPLPNLETKFVVANTLIGKQSKAKTLSLFEAPEIEELKNNLLEIRKKHFYAKTEKDKKHLRHEDEVKRERLSQLIQENSDFTPDDIKQFSQWNPYDQNACSPFFDAEWMFGVKDGFDVVIGNPPYIQLQKNQGELAKKYEKCNYQTFAKSGDIYSLFYERGYFLLKEKGILCFITSNKWMRAEYGKQTRKFFVEKTNPLYLIDFSGQRVFESATVDTNILLLMRDKNRQELMAVAVKFDSLNNLSDYFQQHAQSVQFQNDETWVILNPIEQQIKAKIEKYGIPLKEWDISINYGIKTGFNEAFIIDGQTKDKLIAEDPKSAEIIRPILRGRDIKKYSYEFADLWLINTHNGIKEKGIPPIDIDDYPIIKKHLQQYYIQLSKRVDKGDTPYHLRNCTYMEDFFKPKIVYPNMTKFLPFVLDEKGYLLNQKCFFITGKHLIFLTAFLNSKIFKICFKDNFPELLGGTRELSKVFFEKLRIPLITDIEEKHIAQIMSTSGIDTSVISKEIENYLIAILDLSEYEDYILSNE
ncbi:Eco57I restriction-modification methylase domain-containing protein [Pelistega sp. MC2]|uniref:Eco57I restriction-modification methylase domain-containing protein n=1 Tax=Pelistega sp. MC2 TaxID=1720297 RepID=UPI0008DAEDFD|nr:Eco57I restriction-modification methylase domain-containing protein [Pelistega sp. MC2]